MEKKKCQWIGPLERAARASILKSVNKKGEIEKTKGFRYKGPGGVEVWIEVANRIEAPQWIILRVPDDVGPISVMTDDRKPLYCQRPPDLANKKCEGGTPMVPYWSIDYPEPTPSFHRKCTHGHDCTDEGWIACCKESKACVYCFALEPLMAAKLK